MLTRENHIVFCGKFVKKGMLISAIKRDIIGQEMFHTVKWSYTVYFICRVSIGRCGIFISWCD
jgi:hypothetical protein